MDFNVSFWAVLAAAIVNLIVGSIWYGPLFGNIWKKLMGVTDETMKNMKLSAGQAMVGDFIMALIMAYVLGHFVILADARGLAGAWELAFWVWLGFQLTIMAGGFLWEGKPLKLLVLNAAEQLVATFLMTITLILFS